MVFQAAGTAEHSFSSALLQEQPDDDYLVKWAAASTVSTELEPTSSQLEGFFLAMSLYPDVQAEAQRELDLVIGKDRLPDISDRSDLPYMNALCKEVLRWHNANPTGIPHRTREDFIYDRRKGQPPVLIPKDSIIIPNMWYMAHDPKRYPDPMTFNPRRFLNMKTGEAELDPSRICFGYGRRLPFLVVQSCSDQTRDRICAGKLFADTFIFLICSTVLSLFNINKASKNGVVVEPAVGQTSGTVRFVSAVTSIYELVWSLNHSRPLPFACTVVPRSDDARSLIEVTRGA
ncbi:hypothetical protein MSAN_00859500 [Mycena sanguinolenta]|uniref:Cytochrome P450 n=1 Tax=Mycena sanguinolenta TaxID=230812 RepID=A0A8H7DA64_9AGAR|nr:hypothetical protein MSAN_00859500 [Mycena sanguinolenta]